MQKSGCQTQSVQSVVRVRVRLVICLDVSITVVCVEISFVTIALRFVASSVFAHAMNVLNDVRIDWTPRSHPNPIDRVRKRMLGFVFFNSRRYTECFVQLMLCSYVVRVSLLRTKKKPKHTGSWKRVLRFEKSESSTASFNISSCYSYQTQSNVFVWLLSDILVRFLSEFWIAMNSSIYRGRAACDHFLRTPYESLSDTDIVNFLQRVSIARDYSIELEELTRCKNDENSVKSERMILLRKVMYEAHQKYREASKKPFKFWAATLDSSSDMDSSSDSLDSSNDMDSSNDSRKKDEIVEVEKRYQEDYLP